tara:strand:- start:270 stop:449 length:180 start_codon:yes stop_codon:yes gene_type:complete
VFEAIEPTDYELIFLDLGSSLLFLLWKLNVNYFLSSLVFLSSVSTGLRLGISVVELDAF